MGDDVPAAATTQQALSFGQAADVYERSRPGYPAAALDWLLPPAARAVVDVGAGTGKLTRQLVGRGLAVAAVEPDDAMRHVLERLVPQARALAGTGEALPLPEGCADAVLYAQSWHWVDATAAAAEAARVLAPGGRLCLLWNLRDSRVDWIAELDEILAGAGASQDSMAAHPGLPGFAAFESHQVAWEHRLPIELLPDLVASRSYVILLPDARREALLARVRDLVATHPELAGRPEVSVPYVTWCERAERSGSPTGR